MTFALPLSVSNQLKTKVVHKVKHKKAISKTGYLACFQVVLIKIAEFPSLSAIFFAKKMANEDVSLLSYERLFVKFYLRKNRKKIDNQRKMILKSCFCLAPIRVL